MASTRTRRPVSKPAAKPAAKPRTARQDWASFQKSLAAVLGTLAEDQCLIVSTKREPWFVQFAAQGAEGMRVEAVSNHYLGEGSRLTKAQEKTLTRAGWLAPTGGPGEATPDQQPGGSPNFFRDYPSPVSHADVAALATDTLARIFGVESPSAMEYQAFEPGKGPVLLPALGLDVRPEAPRQPEAKRAPVGKGHDFESVREIARKVVRAGMNDEALDYDSDGDLRARFGSAVAYVRPLPDPLCVRVFSPVVSGVEATPDLQEKLNDLNARVAFARFLISDGTVIASVDVPAAPLVPDHLDNAIGFLGRMADDMDDHFQADFGGRTAYGEFRPPPEKHRMGFKV